jgi:G3E family GTPase
VTGQDVTDFIVLTGFLGSGKTTLLADFLKLPEAADTAIIVNEVGEVGLDGAILAETGGVPIALLENGCLCCALGDDLERAVAALVETRPSLARIILETSGVSKPGPILRSLAGLAPLRLRVGVTATYDCRAGVASAGFEEAAAQWAGAQTLVLTKRDLVSAAELRRARKTAAGLNPLAEIIDTTERAAALRAAFSIRQTPLPPISPGLAHDRHAHHHPRLQILLARPDPAMMWDDLAEWLDNLAGLAGERLLRVKGVVRVADRPHPILIQSVGTFFAAPRPFAGLGGQSFLVLILRDTTLAELAAIAPTPPLSITPLG